MAAKKKKAKRPAPKKIKAQAGYSPKPARRTMSALRRRPEPSSSGSAGPHTESPNWYRKS